MILGLWAVLALSVTLPANAETPSFRLDKTALDEALIDALAAACDETGWFEVADTDLRGPCN